MKKPLAFLLLALVVLPVLAGCNATNDNPISPEKMTQIRQKEDADRRNFNPTNGAPVKSPGTGR